MIYFEQKSKSKVIWRVLSYICAGVALFLIINFSVLAFYAKKQRSLEQEQTRTEQKIGKQLIDREIAKLEKEKQEAELQKQIEERLKAEKEAEEAKVEKAEIARKNNEQQEERERQQQVLAAQQAATAKETERQQAEILREQQILDQNNKEILCKQEAHIFASVASTNKFEEVYSQKLSEYNSGLNNNATENNKTFAEEIQSTFGGMSMALEFARSDADRAAEDEYQKVYWEKLDQCLNR